MARSITIHPRTDHVWLGGKGNHLPEDDEILIGGWKIIAEFRRKSARVGLFLAVRQLPIWLVPPLPEAKLLKVEQGSRRHGR